jgi:hypothetical protein
LHLNSFKPSKVLASFEQANIVASFEPADIIASFEVATPSTIIALFGYPLNWLPLLQHFWPLALSFQL